MMRRSSSLPSTLGSGTISSMMTTLAPVFNAGIKALRGRRQYAVGQSCRMKRRKYISAAMSRLKREGIMSLESGVLMVMHGEGAFSLRQYACESCEQDFGYRLLRRQRVDRRGY